MDLFNRPPSISEDTLQYTLYPPDNLSDRAATLTLATLIHEFVRTLLPEFLWHRDPFQLKVGTNPDGEGHILEGVMRVGDCVDDEWCVVWLLREISRKWDMVISVIDSDGEFLLIEAAESLPSWVTPSNAENRVWIYNSHLHLIPLIYVSPPSSKRKTRYSYSKDSDEEGNALDQEESEFLNASDAIKIVRDPESNTRAPDTVESTVWQRIARYPAAVKQHVHITRAWLPVDVAKILHVDPTLVQKPVETFYTRDAVQLRSVHRMARFSPQPSVLTTVKMTRAAYAQLVGQKFHPPKIWGRWPEMEGSKEWRWRDIGMKLACGFEMLYQESKNRSDVTKASNSAEQGRNDALRRDSEYIRYIENLRSSGYFKGEVEGSELWKSLENKAAMAFIDARRADDATRPSFAFQINTALSEAADVDFSDCPPEESDDWLNIDAGDFDVLLQDRPKHASPDTPMEVDSLEDKVAGEQASKLQNLAKKIEEFVEGEGDLEGARFADDLLSDEDSIDSDSDSDHQPETEDNTNNPQDREAAMKNLVPALDPAEYGKMPPAFYVNSQKVAPSQEAEPTPDVAKKEPSSVLPDRPIRPPILPRNKYEGVDSDDETDEDDAIDEESDEDHPEVVGEIEPDMEEEEEEFLEFSRRALGISNEEWNKIIDDRKNRGAFVPSTTFGRDHLPMMPPMVYDQGAVLDNTSRKTAPTLQSNANPNLDSFESVMQAMDVELARSRPSKFEREGGVRAKLDKGKGKGMEADIADNGDIEAAMEAELKAMLENDGMGSDDEDMDTGTDYNLIKNFLESFKSQAGLSGPVSNLAGRLQPGWKLPRDES